MRKYLSPDYYVNTYRDVTVEFLAREGIRYLILDIDNTLAPYEQPEPDEEHLAWFAALSAAGVRAVFVSNNKPVRVTLFNERIGIPFFAKAGKPGRRSMRRAMEKIGATPEETAMMGDQIFTDVWAGRRVGVRTILLPPIRDKRDLGTRLKRLFEKPILRYYRKHKKTGDS
ncbi:MAG: YqeG family HAD IIIA-type phosphatase [Eubacteriales bacterium]